MASGIFTLHITHLTKRFIQKTTFNAFYCYNNADFLSQTVFKKAKSQKIYRIDIDTINHQMTNTYQSLQSNYTFQGMQLLH